MIPKKGLENVNKTLQDVCTNDLIVLGGDFRQIFPVMKNDFKNLIIEETITSPKLWSLSILIEKQYGIKKQIYGLKMNNILPSCWI